MGNKYLFLTPVETACFLHAYAVYTPAVHADVVHSELNVRIIMN
jgi:hypothetical protein